MIIIVIGLTYPSEDLGTCPRYPGKNNFFNNANHWIMWAVILLAIENLKGIDEEGQGLGIVHLKLSCLPSNIG